MAIESTQIEEFCEFMRGKNVSEEVIEAIESNKITKELFFQMNESDVKEIAPLLADRLIIRKMMEEKTKTRQTPSKVSV